MVGERVRALRKERGLTQEALERASGVEQTTISGIERGRVKSPGADILRRLAAGLGVDVSDLTGREEPEALSEDEWGSVRAAFEALSPSDQRTILSIVQRLATNAGTVETDLRDLDADERATVLEARPELRPAVANALRRLREIDRGRGAPGEMAEQRPHAQARR
jgi:transcriptional regulator with XRE-family HTH domain